ncbi:hypothetical protein ABRP87_03380 [Corynebacterium sp. KPL2830]|uniref:DUF3558 family protein n=1 Tax=Corynebacterium sp. KPL2830 TaxID=3158315 RepID=UPI0032EEC08A
MKRQATVAALVVSSVALSACVAEVGSRSASEDAAMTTEADGTSSVDGAGDANGNQGDDVEDNAGDSEHSKDEDTSAGAGLRGETGATADGDSGVLPPPGEFDPADPDFELFDPCTEVPPEKLEVAGVAAEKKSSYRESGWSYCAFNGGKEYQDAVIALESTVKSIDEVKEGYSANPVRRGANLPIVSYKVEGLIGNYCSALFQTSRGTLKLGFMQMGSDSVFEDCQNSENIIENLAK